jgi:acetyl-CoA carboxylase biotin carboxyl carrier protein
MTKIDKIDIENIKLITKETKLNNLSRIKIKKGDYEIELSSESSSIIDPVSKKIPASNNINVSEEKITSEEIKEENIVKSPMVGVAYLSADPNSPAYVKVGQHVKAGDTLLLIEAMKTFNEIKAPKSGVIKKIVALNSQPVEFGDHLLIFE